MTDSSIFSLLYPQWPGIDEVLSQMQLPKKSKTSENKRIHTEALAVFVHQQIVFIF